jgi:antitoxin (DNA-binding transcriptional repressor) of toxin-antitoxin stability system
MDGRRRHPRYLVIDGWHGTARLGEDVTIEELGNHEVSVLSLTPARTGDEFTLEVHGNPVAHLSVSVLSSTPVVAGEGLHYRLHLRVNSAQASADNTEESPSASEVAADDPQPARDLGRRGSGE